MEVKIKNKKIGLNIKKIIKKVKFKKGGLNQKITTLVFGLTVTILVVIILTVSIITKRIIANKSKNEPILSHNIKIINEPTIP